MNVWREARFVVRQLLRAPGYTLTALATLSLAIAVNASILGSAFALLRPPDAIQHPGDLVVARSSAPHRNTALVEVTYRQFEAWARSDALSQSAAFGSSHWPMVFESGTEPLRLAVSAVSASFFDTLGTTSRQGRGFTPADDARASGWVAVLNHRVWRDRFSADPTVVGSTITLDGKAFTIVGVTPEGFDFPRGTDLWTPVVPLLNEVSARSAIDAFEGIGVLYVLGRLRPEASTDTARDDFQRLAVGEVGGPPDERRAVVTPFLEHVLGPFRSGVWWLVAAAAVLLLVASANLSALALTRVLARRRDEAIRLALGASGAALARHWLLECLAITAISVLAGMTAAHWAMAGIVTLAPDDVPQVAHIGLNLPVAIMTILVAGIAMALWAAAPMLATRSRHLVEALHYSVRATPGRRVQRFRASLVVAQICLSAALLVVAGLIVHSFINLQHLDLGFDPDRVLTVHVEPSRSTARTGAWFHDLADRLGTMPAVEAAGAVLLRPLVYGPIGSDEAVLLQGQPETLEAALHNPHVNYQTATPGYFRAMRIPLLRGRGFDDRDRAAAPRVVLVGERAARALWPGDDPVGQLLAIPSLARGDAAVWRTVIGVVKDVHYRGLGDIRLDVYEPAAQAERHPESIVVRTAGSPLSAVAAVQGAIREADPRAIISGMTTLDAVVSRAMAPWRMTAWILGIAGASTLLLALVGLLGQLGIEVAHRRQEFAIRLAVGAGPGDIQADVMRRAAKRTLIGTSVGLLMALAATRWMDTLLFGVTPLDPVTWAAALAGTCLTTSGLSLVIARRAATLSPAAVLNAP